MSIRQRTKWIPILLTLGFATLVGSCAFYHERAPGDPATVTAQTVSWPRVYQDVFGPRCAICHGQGGAGIDVTDYNSVLRKLSRIQRAVLNEKSMPPDSDLTDYERTLLSTWIQNGTPYTASGGTP